MDNSRWNSRFFFRAFCVIAFLSASAAAYGQYSLSTQTDIRSRGMGEVAAAVPDNPMGFLYNPACLADAHTIFARFTYALWPAWIDDRPDLYAGAAGFSQGSWLNLGAALQRFNLCKMTFTDDQGAVIGILEPYDMAVYLGYAAAPTPWLSAGFNVKYVVVHETIFYITRDRTTSTVGFDIGLYFHGLLPYLTAFDEASEFDPNSRGVTGVLKRYAQPRSRGLSFGIALQNIGPNFSPEHYLEIPLPHNVKIGFAWRLVDLDPIGVLIAADMNRLVYSGMGDIFKNIDFHFGAEVSLLRLLQLRAGYVSLGYDTPHYTANDYLTLGASLGFDNVHLNMGYIPESDPPYAWADIWFLGLTVDF